EASSSANDSAPEMGLHLGAAEPAPLAYTEEVEGICRKCCSCHKIKALIEGNDVRGKCDFSGNKSQWRCSECNNLKSRIARIQASAHAIAGWNDVKEAARASFMGRAAGLMKDDLRKAMSEAVTRTSIQRRTLSFKASGDYINIEKLEDEVKEPTERESIRNNAPRLVCPISNNTNIWIPVYSATQQEDRIEQEERSQRAETEHVARAKVKAKAKAKGKARAQAASGKEAEEGAAEAAAGEEADGAAGAEPVAKRRRRSGKGPGEEKPEDKTPKEKPIKELTPQQNERLQTIEGKLQDTSLHLHATICEANGHKGTKVPTDTLDKANEVAAEVEKLVKTASDMHAAGKAPQGVVATFFKDAKNAMDEAKGLSAKMCSLISD
ncbi:unnamed protein product, partial [Prorocentrum cordatum]